MAHRIVIAVALSVLFVGCSSTPTEVKQRPATSPEALNSQPAKGPVKPPSTDEEMTKSALSAAPEAIARNATIIAVDEKMQVKQLRQGSNGWTCIPDGPSPGVDPMCVDKNGLEWVQAWMAHKEPPANKMGFGYMLAGGSDASNEDPFAAQPAAGHAWVETGPHVMIFNVGSRFDGYPTTHDDTTKPYIMWSNTPYAHLMIPVK